LAGNLLGVVINVNVDKEKQAILQHSITDGLLSFRGSCCGTTGVTLSVSKLVTERSPVARTMRFNVVDIVFSYKGESLQINTLCLTAGRQFSNIPLPKVVLFLLNC